MSRIVEVRGNRKPGIVNGVAKDVARSMLEILLNVK